MISTFFKILTGSATRKYRLRDYSRRRSENKRNRGYDLTRQRLRFALRAAKVLQRRFSKLQKCPKALCFQGFSGTYKQFCAPLSDVPNQSRYHSASGMIGWPACGARCAPCRRRGCVAHRPRRNKSLCLLCHRQRKAIYSHSMVDFWFCRYVVVATIIASDI